MTPTPQEHAQPTDTIPTQHDGNRIVISGMSGLYPQSNNVKEFSDVLYNKINPITQKDLRFKYNHPEVVQYTGSVPDLSSFDAQFFKVHYRQANCMDPMSRKVLEQAFQAIYDAGINPEQLSGKKVGVYIGSCFSETEKASFYEATSRTGFGIAGCNKSMFANRISYWLNAKGPSMSIDEACCSSTAALEQAYLALSRGECEAAVVGGTYLCLHPQSSLHFGRIIRLCSDGKTKSFDERADGCARSEAINVLFLQKAKDAMRVYAEVLHAQTEFTCMLKDETGPKYGFYRDLDSTTNFIKKFYKQAGVPPHVVKYVEAVGSALPEVDKVELQAIEDVYCQNRDDPLYIGSVMSNIGYGEAASGISAITKVLLGYHNGQLAANLHSEHPRKDIAALCDGRMRIVTEHQPFDRTYVAVNGMSVTGMNSHVLLHGCYKARDLNRYATNIPHLVTLSGRHEEAVRHMLEVLKSNPIDPEQLALIHNIHRMNVSGHLGRGFTILHTNNEQKTVSLCEKADYFDNARRPLWFVYSGMGSQWAGMGKQLMRIPIFAAAIERCRKALEPKGLDIVHIITSDDETIFNNILHSFVGIAAIQIGLTDILHELGLKPDGIIGHSVGELGCAYADGCLTAEEMILSAYYRGLVSVETEFIHGSMAAVGLGFEEVSKLCPPEIEVACHNGPDSSTISGPSDVMREFVAKLSAKGIFAKEVPCSNIAYHSRYIADAGPGLLKYLHGAIPIPKARSKRWLSTSVPQDKWNEPVANLCSAEYLTNNLLNSVLFDETSRLLPNDAVLVEIAPHGLLQAILKRSMPATCKNIPLTRRKHPDNTVLLLEAIGKLFMEGYNCNLEVLYPKVEMPVSTGTPFLSHFVKWAHGEKWPLAYYRSANRRVAANCNFVLSIHDKEHNFLKGHTIRGKTLYPFAASLTLVWDVLAMITNAPKKELSVEFSKLQLHSQPVITEQRQLKLSVAIHRGTGYFEVLEDSSTVITGIITATNEKHKNKQDIDDEDNQMYFSTDDIYRMLRDRDYFYSGQFQSIAAVDESLSSARLVWRDNWVTFIDGILQLNALQQTHNAVSQPTDILRIIIDLKEHSKAIAKSYISDGVTLIDAKVSDTYDKIRCGGVLIETIKFQHLPPYNSNAMALKSLKFVPHFNSGLDVSSSLEVYLQIVAENLNKNKVNIVGIRNNEDKGCMFKKIKYVGKNILGIKVDYKEVDREMALKNYKFDNADLILVENLSSDENVCQRLQENLPLDKFVISEEVAANPGSSKQSSLYRVLSITNDTENIKLHLIRWGSLRPLKAITTVSIRKETDINFLTSVRTNLANGQHLLVISSYPTPPGLKELVYSWRNESAKNKINLITINNSINDDLEESIRDIDLAFNTITHDKWGGEYILPVNQSTMESRNITLQGTQMGDYDSLKWVNVPESTGTGVTVNVHFAGINNNDLKQVNGSLLLKSYAKTGFGMDFSGTTESGKRVMGIVHSGAASSKVNVKQELLWPVPPHWSLEEAATVPLAYVQAFYCLAIKVQLPRGQTVFVHGGAGALGQAIISILVALDCEIFTTVSDIKKKRFLQKLYPTLKADHIGCSRDHTFREMVNLVTKGTNCDLVINCVKGELKDLSVKCTSFGGYFLDISQLQNGDDYKFGMYHLTQERNYVSIDFSTIFEDENVVDLKKIHNMISHGISCGYVRPLSRVTYAPNETARAFRVLAASSHRGRVLIRMKENIIQAQCSLRCREDRSNVIICGNTEFGLQFADRLVTRGAKQLYLNVPTKSTYLTQKIRFWKKSGVQVIVSSESLNSQKAIASLFSSYLSFGPIEGVYIVVEGTNVDNDLVSNIDTELRNLHSDLRYFAVINLGDNTIGKNVCLNRINEQLPATLLILPEIKVETYSSYMDWRGALDAVEHALNSDQGVIVAHENRHKLSLMQEIAKFVGINVQDETANSLTLEELGIQNHKLQPLSKFLRVHYNLAYNEEQILTLTKKKIFELEKKLNEFPYEDTKGLSTFFNYIDSDELLATIEMVLLPTLVNNASMRDDEFESNQDILCIVPGMEGHHERFRILCERLKLPALVLQPGLDHPEETVVEKAHRFAEVMLKKTEMKKTFYLLGYETGINVALEVAAILEDHGLSGKVFCLGGTPEEFEKVLEEQLSSFENEQHLQDEVLRHMYSLMTGSDTQVLDHLLQNLSTWSQKLEVCVRTLLGRVSHSAQYARSLIKSALANIKQVRHCSIALRPLRSQVILIRAALGNAPLQDTVLQHISQQPFVVHQLDSSLAYITKDLRCTAIINEHLDPTILENFKTRNICDTYLLNANSFMTRELENNI